jgi:hypothetical protein
LLAYSGVLAISFLPSSVFHLYPALYFIACLGQYFSYFISPWHYISLLAQSGVLAISFLASPVFHCLPGAMFQPFHYLPTLVF